jgi:two-component system cell cycle sensor histidine kinase PleC
LEIVGPPNHSATGDAQNCGIKGDRVQNVTAVEWGESVEEQGQEALLETLHCLRVAITIFDADTRLIFASAHLNHIFRKLPPVKTLTGKFYEELVVLELPEISPAALSAGVDAFIAGRLSQLGPRAWEPRDIPLADGRIIEIKARRAPNGNAILLWADVTAARHQVTRLGEAITLSADAFAFFDAQDRFLTGNAQYAQMTGMSLAELNGRSFETIITDAAHSGRVALDVTPDEWIQRRLRGHRATSSADTLQTTRGIAYLVRDHVTPDGGRAVVFTDITEKTRAENALVQVQSALETSRNEARRQTNYLADLAKRLDSVTQQADNAKTMLLRTMSHELKTPLNAILGFSDLIGALSENLSPAQVREYAGLIHQGGCNLLKMVNQIMDLTKISAGRYDLRKVVMDAGSAVWQARESFITRAQAKSVTIDADDCSHGVMVEADENVFGGMVNALIDNAVSFTREGGAIKLSVTPRENMIAITIADNGPGVAVADLKRILEPFEHAGRAQDHASGAGLGLTLVHAFAELHCGALEIESASGKGFRATLLLPKGS